MNSNTSPVSTTSSMTLYEEPVVEVDKSWFGLVRQVCWTLGYIITLGYSNKYARKIQKWDVSNNASKYSGYGAMSVDQASIQSAYPGTKASPRAKQQREWDRLSTTLSVITATSAAALAIPSPFKNENTYWLSFACFSAAFGLSLEGLILITYLTVFGASSSAESVGRIAKGECALKGLAGPVAFVVSLPTALTTYSSLFLLTGLLSMTIVKGRGDSIEEHETGFNVIVLVPVFLMLVCIIVAVLGGEIIARGEAKKGERMQVPRGDGGKTLSLGVDLEARTPVIPTGFAKPSGYERVATLDAGEKDNSNN